MRERETGTEHAHSQSEAHREATLHCLVLVALGMFLSEVSTGAAGGALSLGGCLRNRFALLQQSC